MPIPQPQPGQNKEKFLSGCMGTLADEYEDPAQRYAVCIGSWLDKYSSTIGKFWYKKKSSAAAQHFSNSVQTIRLKFAALNISFDFDDTLTTDRGQELAKKLMEAGNKIYIVTRRQEKDSKSVYEVADELGIPHTRVYFTNGSYKWKTLKRLGINEHYDNNPEEIKQIDQNAPEVKGIKFFDMR